jgi:flotillin
VNVEEILDRIAAVVTPVLIGVAAFVLLLVWAIKSLRHICGPNEVLIFTGKRRRGTDGLIRGYHTVFGGGGWRTPVIGKVDRMGLNVMEVPIHVRNAYSKGGIALNVDAAANVKISSDPRLIGNAIERFLGRDPAEIRRVAKETLEGHLRGVLARLTPEEVNEDRLRFAEELSVESELDLNKLGIHLDTLKIQHVSDERQYLDSIGREAIANIIMEAEMTESDAKRDAELAEAGNEARGSVMMASAETVIVKMRNDLRRIQADLEAEVRSEEERMLAAAREARAKAEQELQQIRSQLEEVRLRTDKILPAEAHRTAQEHRARGEAAILRERGLAASQALELMNRAWNDAGESALSIYILEDIEKILEKGARAVQRVKIDSLNIIDTGDGQSLPNYMAAYPAMLDTVFAAVSRTTGIDIPKAISAPKRVPEPASGGDGEADPGSQRQEESEA